MLPWVKNSIGVAVVLILLAIGWRLFQGDGGEAKVWEFGVSVHPKTAASSASSTANAPTTAVAQEAKPVATPTQCRLPEHGTESWAKTEKWAADSDWRKGGSSPAEFCGAQKFAREAKFPAREVALLGTDEKHKSEYTPFKHDFYRYSCLFEDRWEPIFKLAENTRCPAQ